MSAHSSIPSSSTSSLPSDSSSSTPSTSLFFLWLPDYTDSDAQRRRAEATPRHLKQMMANVVSKQRGDYGGVTTMRATSANARQAAKNHMIDGTIVIVEAESVEAVWRLIEQDVFYTENVWDKERIVIKPFIPTLPHRQIAARM
ncbi:hypothetical protein BDY19DRAFT_994822 [Irpex rosettiformis]|uniref:Uncharacterized protein n=1 Tax=Irpex rosettiformis TaxID=378272 RepID=A0ACB8TZH8_9APHY|nr:hypothetical protein BDY19DRAFT_994822 [Irpex rosettiformis]